MLSTAEVLSYVQKAKSYGVQFANWTEACQAAENMAYRDRCASKEKDEKPLKRR